MRRLPTSAALFVLLHCTGCALVRYADVAMPAIRLDRPSNASMPADDAPAVKQAIDTWTALTPEERLRFPTPYHVFVDTPAPGTFEGDFSVALAFSGGGTRGTVFAACCVKALAELGDIVVETPGGPRKISLLDEVDYVSGASTGVIPAAAFALNRGETCPDHLDFQHWPECFNRDLVSYTLTQFALRPYRILRDMTVGMNTRPALAAAVAAVFFEGSNRSLRSGLTLGDLPPTPVLFLNATVINEPGTLFVQTRLPYRYAIDAPPPQPWETGVQSFESFHSDPMRYPLGEACYNSLSFPGQMRSGLMAMRAGRSWVLDGLEAEQRARMARSRHQPGYEGVYELKDGGLVDNRGVASLDRLLAARVTSARPLLIILDASYLELRAPAKGGGVLKKGWFNEVRSSTAASWQSGQDAHERLFAAHAQDGAYVPVRLELTAWTDHLPDPTGVTSAKARHLAGLCAESERIRSHERLLEVLRGIGTTIADLDEAQMEALRIAAEFAVWAEAERILAWASEAHGGGSARFSRPTPNDG
jgi:hypothetical protein